MNDYKELIDELHWYSKNRYDCDYKLLIKTIDDAADVIEQLSKERDAAIATIPHKCWSCGKGYQSEHGFECEETHYKGNNPNCLSWEWRGVTE